MKNNILGIYSKSKIDLLKLWLNNYEFGESLRDITEWVRFQAIDEFAQKLVLNKSHNKDNFFDFRINLEASEESTLCDYLLKRKSFVIRYILKRGSFSPNTYLYQLYLQYLPDQLNEIEKNILLEGYLHMLRELQGENYADGKRLSLVKEIN